MNDSYAIADIIQFLFLSISHIVPARLDPRNLSYSYFYLHDQFVDESKRRNVEKVNKNRLSYTTCGEELQKSFKDWQKIGKLAPKIANFTQFAFLTFFTSK